MDIVEILDKYGFVHWQQSLWVTSYILFTLLSLQMKSSKWLSEAN